MDTCLLSAFEHLLLESVLKNSKDPSYVVLPKSPSSMSSCAAVLPKSTLESSMFFLFSKSNIWRPTQISLQTVDVSGSVPVSVPFRNQINEEACYLFKLLHTVFLWLLFFQNSHMNAACSLCFLYLYFKYSFDISNKDPMDHSVSALSKEHVQNCLSWAHVVSVQSPSICLLMVLFSKSQCR
jgi:hypothetical protein